jgi:hypothetical protein
MPGPGRRLLPTLAAAAILPFAGCVERRFVLESNVPGAQIYVNDAAVGPSPADARWDYAGKYKFKVVAPGYEPLTDVRSVPAKWYDYPPLDFVFENLWPFHIEDVRRFQFNLSPIAPVRTDELLDNANRLRERGRALESSERN